MKFENHGQLNSVY